MPGRLTAVSCERSEVRAHLGGIGMFWGLHAALQLGGGSGDFAGAITADMPADAPLEAPAPRKRHRLQRTLSKRAFAAVAGCLLALPGVAQAQLSQGCQDINANSGVDGQDGATPAALRKTYTWVNGSSAGEQSWNYGPFTAGEQISYSYTYSGGASAILGMSTGGFATFTTAFHTEPGSGSGSGTFTVPAGFQPGGDYFYLGHSASGSPTSAYSLPGSTVSITSLSCAAATPVLGVAMTHSGNATQGQQLAYTITPNTSVLATTTATLTAAFTLPTGMTYVSASGTGWSCSGSGQSGSCTRTTSFAVGNGPAITLTAQFATNATTPLSPSVTLSGGGASNTPSASDSTTVLQLPTVTSLSPTVGTTAGGTSVTITGTNLTGATAVAFGATAATGFTVNSGTQITATSPAGAAGTVNVRVTTPVGTSATAAANQFTYSTPPAAPSVITPANGATIGTATPVYTGTSDANVTITLTVDGGSIGTTTADASGNWSRTQPTSLAAGSHTVSATATNADGITGPASATNTFTYVVPPVASAFTAAAVPYNAGSAAATTFSVTAHVTNSPTSYAVGSATTAQGGSVSIDSAGLVSYTPPASYRGNDMFSFTATNAGGTSNSALVTVPVSNPTLTISLTGSGTRGTALSGVQLSTTGGTGPYSCSTTLASGALPSGTTLNSNCTITGTPTASGSFTFTANVTDSSLPTGFTQTSGSLVLNIAAPTVSISPAAGALPGATAGASYSQTITTSGGTAPYSYAHTGALPAGVTLSTGGVLSGTPTAVGTYNFTVTATDSSTAGSGGPYTASAAYSLTVAPPSITLSPTTLASPAVGTAYSASVSASGGNGSYSYSVASGALPPGLSLNPASGAITGTPTSGGSFTFTISAADTTTGAGAPYSGSQSYTVTVGAPTIAVSPTSLSAATVGTSYSASLTASGGTAPYGFAVSGGALPAGLSLAANGTLSGTPTAGGSFSFDVTATDASGGAGPYTGTRSYALTVNTPTIAVGPVTVPGATAGVAYSQSITASGGTTPYSYAVTAGALPAGLTLATNGTLSGTPTAGGTFNFTVTATDGSTGTGPYSGSRAYTLTVAAATITVAPTSLPNWSAGTPYNQTVTASGGNGTYSFAVTAGALPPGWTLSSAGLLSGTATESNSFNFTITATDQSTGTGAPYSGSRAYTVNVGSPVFTLTPPTLSATAGQAYTGNFVAGGGTAPYTYSRFAGTLPPGLTLATDGTLSGTPTATGTFNFSVVARDSTAGAGAPYGVASNYNFTVAAPTLSLSPTTVPNGTVGSSYSQTVTASGGTAPYALGRTGILPAGISFNAPTGTISGTPTEAGTFNFTISTTDSTGGGGPYAASQNYTLTIAAPTVSLSPATLPSATPGTAYSETLTASGGTPGYTYTVSAGALPAGVTLSAAGVLSGTPSVAGTFNFTATATDSSTGTGAPFSASQAYTLSVGTPTITVDTTSLANATAGAAYSASISASGGVAPYSYAVTGALPAGLSLAANGTISGTPTAGGSFTFTVTATDSSGGSGPFSGSRTLTLVVDPAAITVNPATLPAATVATAYSQNLTASGGTAGYSFAVTAGALPAGMTLAADGTLSGTPTAGGTFNFTVTATDSSTGTGPFAGSRAYSLTVGAPTLALAPATLANATVGSAYSGSITASGGTAPYSYALNGGALPAGMALAADGTLSGTPTAGGTFNFTVTATDSSTGTGAPYTASRAYALTVGAATLAISPATLPAGQMGSSYSQALSTAGGTGPYTYTVAAGALPAGVSLSSTGVLSGTPTVHGSFAFTVSSTDSSTGSGPFVASQAYTLTIATPVVPVAGDTSATVAFGSTANPIALPLSGGIATSVAVAAAPAHGTATASGTSISYTPAANYFGSDSFTYTAANAGGTSAPATVTITVGLPPAPTVAAVSGVAVPYASSGTAIDLSASITGVHTGVAVATAPAHGSTSIAGDVVTYVPAAGYFGADSFTYTATGPGGTSAAATVSLTVGLPPAPTVAAVNGVAVPYASTGTAIDLSASITGVHTSVAVATAPAHGTTSVAGDVVTYVPAAGYFGADSFAYTATGPGGTSAPATVTLTVGLPPAPTATGLSDVAVPYASTGTTIDLSASVAGVHTGIAIATAPTHGTATVAGYAVTYIPSAGYFGADSFTFTVTGPGGTSAPATVTLTVGLPPAPVAANLSGVAIPHNSAGTEVDLAASITGVHTSVAIATAPAHGTATVAGDVVTYTPATDYYGEDSFTYTATGPGGTSAAATVTLAVALPPPPVTRPADTSIPGATTTGGSSAEIDLSSLIDGNATSVEIATEPQHGTVELLVGGGAQSALATSRQSTRALGRVVAVYTPQPGFEGTDSFAFVAIGPGGTSPPATVTITVSGVAPVAQDKTVDARDGETATVDLTAGATGGPFNAATIVSSTPTDAATTEIVASGPDTARTYTLRITPAARFDGAIVIRYTLSNAFGASEPATVTVNVDARPDPTADPNVRAISDAQAESTRRFARSQIGNFMQRNESLHNGGGRAGAQMGVRLQALDASRPFVEPDRYGEQATRALNNRIRGMGGDGRAVDGIAAMRGMGTARSAPGAGSDAPGPARPSEDEGGTGERRIGSVALWTGGAIEIGTQDRITGRSKITATSSGLSGGADIKLAENLVLGIGGGYGLDRSDIDGGAAHVRATNSIVAAYGSFAPIDGLFVDGLIATGDLDFRTRRIVAETGALAQGVRDGSMTFGALALGIDRSRDDLRWSAYGRAEWMTAQLGAYSETGAGRMSLRFDARDVKSLSGVLGTRFEFTRDAGFASVTPRVRAEWRHEFEDGGIQFLDYADIPGPSQYSLGTTGWQRDQFELSLGSTLKLPSAWVFDLEMALRGASGERSGTLRAKISKEF